MMFITHKIEYIKNGEKHKILNIPYSEKYEVIDEIMGDDDILDATIQEYPLKYNEVRVIKDGGKNVFEKKKRKHMVSFSGGKDSTAMLIRMLELGMQVDEIVFADTKYEFQEMYDYIDKVEKYIQDRFDPELYIRVLRTEQKLDDWIFGKISKGKRKGEVRGFPLVIFPCNWSRESKIRPLDRAMQGHHRYIGIALDEKQRASKNAKDMFFHYPLIEWGWTEQDCVDYLESIDLTNPIYTDEINRTGCWWCPKQSVGAWRSLYLNHPDKWEELKEKEKNVGKPIRDNTTMQGMEDRFKAELEKENIGE